MLATSSTNPTPRKFGKYLLLERIGRGGMAEVFRSKTFGTAGFVKECAIKKILSSLLDDDQFVRMFVDEAKLTAFLTHPNIVQVLDLGEIDGHLFIAMEYVPGKDLLDVLARSARRGIRVPIELTLYVVMEMLKGLDFAHKALDSKGVSMGIVHRDVSPSNILISYDGQVKVGDFGIAKSQMQSSKTEIGTQKGKTGYMSPEQVTGEPVDHRSDLFAAAVILFELLTMTRLFKAKSDLDVMIKIRDADIDADMERAARVSPGLAQIIRKGLQPNADERFQTAEEFLDQLRDYVQDRRIKTSAGALSDYVCDLFQDKIEAEREQRSQDPIEPGHFEEMPSAQQPIFRYRDQEGSIHGPMSAAMLVELLESRTRNAAEAISFDAGPWRTLTGFAQFADVGRPDQSNPPPGPDDSDVGLRIHTGSDWEDLSLAGRNPNSRRKRRGTRPGHTQGQTASNRVLTDGGRASGNTHVGPGIGPNGGTDNNSNNTPFPEDGQRTVDNAAAERAGAGWLTTGSRRAATSGNSLTAPGRSVGTPVPAAATPAANPIVQAGASAAAVAAGTATAIAPSSAPLTPSSAPLTPSSAPPAPAPSAFGRPQSSVRSSPDYTGATPNATPYAPAAPSTASAATSASRPFPAPGGIASTDEPLRPPTRPPSDHAQAPQNDYGQAPQNDYGQAPPIGYAQAPSNAYIPPAPHAPEASHPVNDLAEVPLTTQHAEREPDLGGSLRDVSVFRLMHRIDIGGLKGRLRVTDEEGVIKDLYFADSLLNAAESTAGTDSLIELLRAREAITFDQAEDASQIHARNGVAIGNVLLQLKAVAPHELFHFLQEQLAEKAITSAFWNAGTWQWFADDQTERDAFSVTVNIGDLLARAVTERARNSYFRRFYKAQRRTPLVRRLQGDDLVRLRLSARAMRIVSSLETACNIADIVRVFADRYNWTEAEVYRTVYTLTEYEVLRFQGEPTLNLPG